MLISVLSTLTFTVGLRIKHPSASRTFLFLDDFPSPSMVSSSIATFTDCSFRSWTILSNDLVLMLMPVPDGIGIRRGAIVESNHIHGSRYIFQWYFKQPSRKYSDPEPLRLSIERPRMKAVNDRSHLHILMKIFSFTTLCSGYHGLRPEPHRTLGTCSINGSSIVLGKSRTCVSM